MSQSQEPQEQGQIKLLWRPTRESIEQSRMYAFARRIEQKYDVVLPDYASLHAWSIENLEDFWKEVWEWFGIVASKTSDQVLTTRETPGAKWFPGACLNYA